MRWPRRGDHAWSQQRLSAYVDGELDRRARARLEMHAQECPECGRGIRALRALLRALRGLPGGPHERAPASIFDRVRAQAIDAAIDRDRAGEA
jgi:anti-sigma factor RsiW